MTKAEQELREQIMKILGWFWEDGEYADGKVFYNQYYDPVAKMGYSVGYMDQLVHLITEREREARIDELEIINAYSITTPRHTILQFVLDRLLALKSKKGNN